MTVHLSTRFPGRVFQIAATIGLASALVVASAPRVRAQTAPASSAAAPATKTSSPAKKKSSRKRRSTRREPSQKAPTPDRISEIQSALSRNGFYEGNLNGKWDSSSVTALQKFQSANGLDPTGKLDALSLQKLGLGSEIAGVFAPSTPHPHPAPAVSPKPTPAAAPTTPATPKPDSASPASSNPQK